MKSCIPLITSALALFLAATAVAQSLGDFLAPGVDLADPAQRFLRLRVTTP